MKKPTLSLIDETKVTKASVKWRSLRTSIPMSVVNMANLCEGQQLKWQQLELNGTNYIIIEGGTKPNTSKK